MKQQQRCKSPNQGFGGCFSWKILPISTGSGLRVLGAPEKLDFSTIFMIYMTNICPLTRITGCFMWYYNQFDCEIIPHSTGSENTTGIQKRYMPQSSPSQAGCGKAGNGCFGTPNGMGHSMGFLIKSPWRLIWIVGTTSHRRWIGHMTPALAAKTAIWGCTNVERWLFWKERTCQRVVAVWFGIFCRGN